MALDEVQVTELLRQLAELKILYQRQLQEYAALQEMYSKYVDRVEKNGKLLQELERRQAGIDTGRLLAGDKRDSVRELFPDDGAPRVRVDKNKGEVYRL